VSYLLVNIVFFPLLLTTLQKFAFIPSARDVLLEYRGLLEAGLESVPSLSCPEEEATFLLRDAESRTLTRDLWEFIFLGTQSSSPKRSLVSLKIKSAGKSFEFGGYAWFKVYSKHHC